LDQESKGIPSVPEAINLGFPKELLRRRPDIRQAELVARAQNALIGMAQADLYPRFSLSGFVGLSAGGPGNDDVGDLFDSDAFTYSLGPNFSWPFLNYGRIKNNVRVQDARLQQALLGYRDTVIRAAREVEDAIVGFVGTREQTGILSQSVKSAERSNELSTLQYREGFTDYQRVLDSQQRLFTEQQRYATNQGNSVRSLVSLNRALGAGWTYQVVPPVVSSESMEAMEARVDWGELFDNQTDEQFVHDHFCYNFNRFFTFV
jgi:outer membrane protein TolC